LPPHNTERGYAKVVTPRKQPRGPFLTPAALLRANTDDTNRSQQFHLIAGEVALTRYFCPLKRSIFCPVTACLPSSPARSTTRGKPLSEAQKGNGDARRLGLRRCAGLGIHGVNAADQRRYHEQSNGLHNATVHKANTKLPALIL